MSEEQPQGLYATIIEQLNKLKAKNESLKKSKKIEFRSGVFVGGTVVGVIAALFSNCNGCNGDKESVNQNNYLDGGYKVSITDAGITDAYASGYSVQKVCGEGQDCYDVKFVGDLERRLKLAIVENEKLSKRPNTCPTYTPKACPPVEECPKLKECPTSPYIRRGD
ncbi:MAG: hypothetical protein AABY40_03790 [Nanoarchaeota archaeon]